LDVEMQHLEWLEGVLVRVGLVRLGNHILFNAAIAHVHGLSDLGGIANDKVVNMLSAIVEITTAGACPRWACQVFMSTAELETDSA
jgi:hypothetical protein